MAKRVFKADLSVKGIDGLIRQLEDYKDSLLSKNDLFVKRLAELGIPVIDKRINQAQGDSDKSHYTHIEINSFGSYSQAKLIVEGRDLLFIEFGAGIHFNRPASKGISPHPLGSQFGYTIGSYGKGLGATDKWVRDPKTGETKHIDYWYYKSDTGEIVRSYGTEATMPMYAASFEIIQKIEEVAREVFGNG